MGYKIFVFNITFFFIYKTQLLCWQISFFCYKNCTVLKYKNHHYWICFKRKSEKDIKKKQQLLSQFFFLYSLPVTIWKAELGLLWHWGPFATAFTV